MPKVVERGTCIQEGEGRRDYSSALEFALVVAASDSSTKSKNGADYVCDGVADEVEINAAMNALPATGGRVELREGTFTIADSITFPADSITLEGQGRGTLIDGDGLATGVHAIVVSGRDHCAIKNLAIQTEDGGGKTSHCIYLDAAGDYLTIDGVVIIDSDSDAINLYDIVDQLTIRNCVIEGADDGGIAVYAPTNSTITNNIIQLTGGRGISAYYSATGVTITNNIITNLFIGDGIYIKTGYHVVIGHNFIWDILGTGDNGIYLEDCHWMAITDNSIYDVEQHGIICDDIEDSVIASNNILNPRTGHGIYIYDGSKRCVVEGNTMEGIAGDGFRLNDVTESSFTGNLVSNGTNGIHLEAAVDNCLISDNLFDTCTTAINIAAATCDKNAVKSNKIRNCTTGITDSGTLTTVEDDNEGITITDIKMFRYVKNTSGAQTVAGDVVILKAVAAGNEITTTTTEGDQRVFGMVAETIADNAFGYVQVKGKTTALKVDGTTDIAIGDLIGCFTTAKIGMKAAAGKMAFAIALEAYATDDSNGVIDALLISPRQAI